jgi:hypothetical protein
MVHQWFLLAAVVEVCWGLFTLPALASFLGAPPAAVLAAPAFS